MDGKYQTGNSELDLSYSITYTIFNLNIEIISNLQKKK